MTLALLEYTEATSNPNPLTLTSTLTSTLTLTLTSTLPLPLPLPLNLPLTRYTSPVWSYMQECSGADSSGDSGDGGDSGEGGEGEVEVVTEAEAERGVVDTVLDSDLS